MGLSTAFQVAGRSVAAGAAGSGAGSGAAAGAGAGAGASGAGALAPAAAVAATGFLMETSVVPSLNALSQSELLSRASMRSRIWETFISVSPSVSVAAGAEASASMGWVMSRRVPARRFSKSARASLGKSA